MIIVSQFLKVQKFCFKLSSFLFLITRAVGIVFEFRKTRRITDRKEKTFRIGGEFWLMKMVKYL